VKYATADTQILTTKSQILKAAVSAVSDLVCTRRSRPSQNDDPSLCASEIYKCFDLQIQRQIHQIWRRYRQIPEAF
jgi:hypothetical protein